MAEPVISVGGAAESDGSTLWDRIRLGLYWFGGIWTVVGTTIYFVKDWSTLGAVVLIAGTTAFLAADSIELIAFPGHSDPIISRTLRYHIIISLLSNACFVISCVGFIPSIYIRDQNPFLGLGWISTFVGCLFLAVLCAWKLILYLNERNTTTASVTVPTVDDGGAAAPAAVSSTRSDPLVSVSSGVSIPAVADGVIAVSINSPLLTAATRFDGYSDAPKSLAAAPPVPAPVVFYT